SEPTEQVLLSLGLASIPSPRAGHEFLKPTIWVSPSRVVALGRNVTIRCEGQDLGMEFVLCKAGHPNQQVQSVVPEGKMAEFPIASVGQEDGGSYTCYYRSITDQSHWSFPSNPVEIIVGGEGGAWLSGPAPSPTPRQTHRGSLQGVRFVLNKEGRHFPPTSSHPSAQASPAPSHSLVLLWGTKVGVLGLLAACSPGV
uniref:Ig-like domain-containing protein n=1 Tax=Gopherus agassizii TaxID=38772 RepID=A0A452J2I3_9SAUR